jgi:hypothetical protein
MNAIVEKISEKVKQRWNKAHRTLNQCRNASKGLIVKITQTSADQFNSLAKFGEERSIRQEIKKAISNFDGPIESAKRMKYATVGLFSKSLGLVSKAKNTGDKYFKEFVSLGENKQKKSHAPKAAATAAATEAKKPKAA